MWNRNFIGHVESSTTPPRTEKCIQNCYSAQTLRIVTIPGYMPTGMNNSSRSCFCHLSGGFTNDVRFDGSNSIRPLRCHVLNMCLQLIETIGILLNIFLVVKFFVNNNMNPCQQKSDIGSRFNRQPVFRFTCSR